MTQIIFKGQKSLVSVVSKRGMWQHGLVIVCAGASFTHVCIIALCEFRAPDIICGHIYWSTYNCWENFKYRYGGLTGYTVSCLFAHPNI